MNLRVSLSVARKDFIDALRNARLLVVILMPIGFSLLYGYLFRESINETEVAFYTPDETELLAAIQAMDNVSLTSVTDPREVEAKVDNGSAAIGVILPAEFDAKLRRDEQPDLDLIFKDDPEIASGFQRALMQAIEGLSGRPPVVNVVSRTLHPAQGSGEGTSEPIFGFFKDIQLQGYFIVLWVMMAVTMNGSFIVPTLLVEEKDHKTLAAILVTPAGYPDVIMGKLLVGLIYSLLSSGMIMFLNNGFTGDPLMSILIIVLISLTMTLIGLLIGGLIDNMSTLNTWSGFILLPLMLPGILAGVPLAGVSPLLTTPLQAMPTFQLVRGLALGLSGQGGQAWSSALILLIESVLLFAAVLWSLRRREA